MDHALIISSTVGGLCIGAAALMMLAFNGRILGISGIAFGLLSNWSKASLWRLAFLLGLLIGAAAARAMLPDLAITITAIPWYLLLIGGFLVGFGTKLANGCTSGHGVCGVGRLSRRSLTATLIFITSGMLTVYILRHIF